MNFSVSLFLLLTLNFISQDAAEGKDLQILLVNCQSQYSISYDGTYVNFVDTVYSGYYVRKEVSLKDRVHLSTASKTLLLDKKDEIIDNFCIVDGFHFQLIIKTKDTRKRIFVGNSYDARVNELVGIFITYLDSTYEPFKLNGIPYFDTEESKSYMLKRQEDCKDKHINAWYNDWCDVPTW